VQDIYFTSLNQINRWIFSYKYIFRYYILFYKTYYVFSAENCALLDCYSACSANYFLDFWPLKMGPRGCSETSARIFTSMWPCIVRNFFIIKPTICTYFTNVIWHVILHVSDSYSVHHQEFIHCTLSNGLCYTGTVLTAFELNQNGTQFHSDPARKLSTNV
jgi:hypothetical protein